MAKIAYRSTNFRTATLRVIAAADAICTSYAQAGYSLTLRQLYYQFVARGLLPNKQSEYKRLGTIVDDARYAGLIDWNHIVDRTREMKELPHWGSPHDENGIISAHTFVDQVMPQFRTSKWDTQPLRMEVWIEKDALIDVIQRPANALDIPYFACRGYNSTSNAWRAARRIERYYDEGADKVIILHLGDHDPEGIDMTRDIEDRFITFLEGDGYSTTDEFGFEIRRIALNMDQVRRYNPPPNPAKETSSRFTGYMRRFGTATSWELDALDPPTIDALIRAEVEQERDEVLWVEAVAKENEGKRLLRRAVRNWNEVATFLDQYPDDDPEEDEEEDDDGN